MQDAQQFENELVEVAVTEILTAEDRHDPISICAAGTACVQVTHSWNQ